MSSGQQCAVGDEWRIYNACKALIERHPLTVKKQNQIRKLVANNKPVVTELLTEYKLEDIVVVVQRLLQKEVFQSERQARLHFPASCWQAAFSEGDVRTYHGTRSQVFTSQPRPGQDVQGTLTRPREETVPQQTLNTIEECKSC